MGIQIGGITIPTTQKEVQNAADTAVKWGANQIKKMTVAEPLKGLNAGTKSQVLPAVNTYPSKTSGGKSTRFSQPDQPAGDNKAAYKIRSQQSKHSSNSSSKIDVRDFKTQLTPSARRPSSVIAQATQKNTLVGSQLPLHLRRDVKPKWGVMSEFNYRNETPAQTAARKVHYKQGNEQDRSNLMSNVGKTELRANLGGSSFGNLPINVQVNIGRAQAFGNKLANSGFIGIAQAGEFIRFGVDSLKGLNAAGQAAPKYFKDTSDLVTRRVKANSLELTAGGGSGVGKTLYGAGSGLVDIGARLLTPGMHRDKVASALQQGQQVLDSAYETQMRKSGVNPQSSSYTSGSGTAQIVTSVVLLTAKPGGGKPVSKGALTMTPNLKTAGTTYMPVAKNSKPTGVGYGTSTLSTSPNKIPTTLKTLSATQGSPSGLGGKLLVGGKNNIVNFSSKRLPPSSQRPGTSVSNPKNPVSGGNTGVVGNSRPGGNNTASSTQSGIKTKPGNVATPSAPSVQPTSRAISPAVSPSATAKLNVFQTNPVVAQVKPQPKPVKTPPVPAVLFSPSSPIKPTGPGDVSPTFPTAPVKINPISSPGRPGTGDQPGKPSKTPLTSEEHKKLAGWLGKYSKPMLEQKLNNYREGKATRDDTLAGTASRDRNNLSRALDQIDRSRVGRGGAAGGSGGSYSAAQVREMWREVGAKGGVKALPEAQVRQLTGITQQALKDANLTDAERGDLQSKLASTQQAQQQYHKARHAGKTNPAVDTASWNLPRGSFFFSNKLSANSGTALPSLPTKAKIPSFQSGDDRRYRNMPTDSSGMHPYVGNALSKIPTHKTGTTVVIGSYTADMIESGPNRIVNVTDELVKTNDLLTTNWRERASVEANQELHVYRTFTHALTGKRMALKVDLNKQIKPNAQDQTMLDKLLKGAGVNISVPMVKFVDEAPANVLPTSLPIIGTGFTMGKFSWAATKLADLRHAANVDGIKVGGVKEKLATQTLDVIKKYFNVESTKSITLPSEWVLHFFKGTGQPKVLDQSQMAILQKDFYRKHPDSFILSDALSSKILQEKKNGRTQGLLEFYTEHDVSNEAVFAPDEDGLYNTIGGYHPGTVYNVNWSVDSDNKVKVNGTKTFIAQDRYNWEAAEFNGERSTDLIPNVPAAVWKVALPEKMLSAFGIAADSDIRMNTAKSIMNGKKNEPSFYGVSDAAFGHLQMGKGFAQPFTTIGVAGSLKVETVFNLKQK